MEKPAASRRHRVLSWLERSWTDKATVYVGSNAALVVVGVAISRSEGAVWAAIGTGLIATGAAGLITFAYVVLHEEEASRARNLNEFGLRHAFAERSVSIKSEYRSALDRATHHIDVMGFGLEALRQDFSNDFQAWAQRCPVRILLIDPQAGEPGVSYADARDLEEGENPGSIMASVTKFLEVTEQIRAQQPQRFQVRLYHTLPSVNIFRADNQMFFGPYFVTGPSRNTPTFLLGHGILFDRAMDHFEQIWASDEHSRPAP